MTHKSNANLLASQLDALILANEELTFQNKEQQKCIAELIMTNQALVMQNLAKDKWVAEFTITNDALTFQEKRDRSDRRQAQSNGQRTENERRQGDRRQTENRIDAIVLELSELTKDLIVQNDEKEARASELQIANKELLLKNDEKEARASELLKANSYLFLANEEIAMTLQELAILNDEKEVRANELELANTDLAIANEELLFQSVETEKRATELTRSYDENAVLVDQMNHMQKLESIGRLTSGIAHDFNNILACILGYNKMNQDVSSDMTDEGLKAELENNTKQIDLASKRAAALINKMLTYCRQGTAIKKIEIKPTKEVINEVLEMLHPALTSRIKLEAVFNCDERIQIDAIDLYQILMNLAVNARDAMKERNGIITFSLKIVTNLTAHCVACAERLEGDFIELSVADNGTGIKPKVISRMFDPFFTTKEQGEGTGLGLSTVSGMVHSSGGHILVDSNMTEPNQGTTFRLLFPLLAKV